MGSYDNKLYAVNPDGNNKWSLTTGDVVFSSPAIGADGIIYVGSDDNKLYAIKPDGTLKWTFSTGDWVDSAPAIGAEGTIYVGSFDNKLYAISEGAPGYRPLIGALVVAVVVAGLVIFVVQGKRPFWPKGRRKDVQAHRI